MRRFAARSPWNYQATDISPRRIFLSGWNWRTEPENRPTGYGDCSSVDNPYLSVCAGSDIVTAILDREANYGFLYESDKPFKSCDVVWRKKKERIKEEIFMQDKKDIPYVIFSEWIYLNNRIITLIEKFWKINL